MPSSVQRYLEKIGPVALTRAGRSLTIPLSPDAYRVQTMQTQVTSYSRTGETLTNAGSYGYHSEFAEVVEMFTSMGGRIRYIDNNVAHIVNGYGDTFVVRRI